VDLLQLSKGLRIQATLAAKPLGLYVKGTLSSIKDAQDHVARVKAASTALPLLVFH
jgi:hypothetical protein